ncbi:uncharacterized protein METZ01_LOCUS484312, partial [marine metagenome]
ISADLISDCSGAGVIKVAGLKAVEELGDTPFKEIAKTLLVRYVATGTLWKMGEMFQLSVELYDTKNKKVVWSDRWQEKWANLPTIKNNLSDGLLKALDTKSKFMQKIDFVNSEAYELYLKAKHKQNICKLLSEEEKEKEKPIIQALLNKSIELDNNLICSRRLLADLNHFKQYENSMLILEKALFLAEKMDDKKEITLCLHELSVQKMVQWRVENNDEKLKECQILAKKCYEIAKFIDDY